MFAIRCRQNFTQTFTVTSLCTHSLERWKPQAQVPGASLTGLNSLVEPSYVCCCLNCRTASIQNIGYIDSVFAVFRITSWRIVCENGLWFLPSSHTRFHASLPTTPGFPIVILSLRATTIVFMVAGWRIPQSQTKQHQLCQCRYALIIC